MRDHGIYLISRLVKCGFTQSDAADNRWDELEDYTHGNELFCRYNPQSCRKKRRRLHGVLSKRSDQDGETAFAGLALQGCLMGDMPSAAGARGPISAKRDLRVVADASARHPNTPAPRDSWIFSKSENFNVVLSPPKFRFIVISSSVT